MQEALAGRWATATADGTTRIPGESGVRLRCYLDGRQELGRYGGWRPSCRIVIIRAGDGGAGQRELQQLSKT
ncbi:DUF6207 family protein [Streptomyces sp. NPDC006235]|uniref:DUF6207 family protein n=1 Tax=Streptomyces sp. NPDC006235 TaxID=3156736 RepID=UPI0033A1A8D5